MLVLPVWAFGEFVRPVGVNPVISPRAESAFIDPMTHQSCRWEASDTFNPGAVVRRNRIVLLYRAEDHSGEGIGNRTSRLGYAESRDGLHFRRDAKPVLFPADDDQKANDWPGGCEDPRITMSEDGRYVVFYTEWNRQRAQLAVATSRDLKHWTKFGPAFRHDAADLAFTKSAAPITKLVGDRQILARIDGKYWIYWGEQGVHAATSTDLVSWEPLRNPDGSLVTLIRPRPGYFDSDLTECGPPAVMTPSGILLFYNGKNAAEGGDERFPANAYCAGQVLFSHDDPTKPIARLDTPFLRPEAPYEKTGQYKEGTVFVEGLVWFHKEWFLYYGCADSRVSVAVFDPKHSGLLGELARKRRTKGAKPTL